MSIAFYTLSKNHAPVAFSKKSERYIFYNIRCKNKCIFSKYDKIMEPVIAASKHTNCMSTNHIAL